MQRSALLVGINDYDHGRSLACAVSDAARLKPLLTNNDDASRSLNYDVVDLVVSGSGNEKVTRPLLRQKLQDLFTKSDGAVLFYFAGHGVQTPEGGYLVTQDGEKGDYGVPMEQVIGLANRSPAREVVLILDCCHSGELGNLPIALEKHLSLFGDGVNVLAASAPNELAYEENGHGVFGDAVARGLEGSAASNDGRVTVTSLISYLDKERSRSAWVQSPVFKNAFGEVPTLRRCPPRVSDGVVGWHGISRRFAALALAKGSRISISLSSVALLLSVFSFYRADQAQLDVARVDAVKTVYGLWNDLARARVENPKMGHLFAAADDEYKKELPNVTRAVSSANIEQLAVLLAQERGIAHYIFTVFEEMHYVAKIAKRDSQRQEVLDEDVESLGSWICGNQRLHWFWENDSQGWGFSDDLRDRMKEMHFAGAECPTSFDSRGPFGEQDAGSGAGTTANSGR